jgi:hypothetical protein
VHLCAPLFEGFLRAACGGAQHAGAEPGKIIF